MGEQGTERPSTEECINALPKELQTPIRGFMTELARSILNQQSSIRGDGVSVTVSPQQVEFYKERFRKILDSGLLNPHFYPPKMIV